jgi:hypothetical protein
MFELDPVRYLTVAALITAGIAWSVIYGTRINGNPLDRRGLRRLVLAAPVLGLLWPVTLVVATLCAIFPPLGRLVMRLAAGKPQAAQAADRPEEGRRA